MQIFLIVEAILNKFKDTVNYTSVPNELDLGFLCLLGLVGLDWDWRSYSAHSSCRRRSTLDLDFGSLGAYNTSQDPNDKTRQGTSDCDLFLSLGIFSSSSVLDPDLECI